MKTFNYTRAVRAALIGIAMTGSVTAARADIKDYEFQLVDQTVKAGPDKIVTVRLVNKTTGKPVPDAVIFATRLDMAPDGMQEMATKIVPVTSSRRRLGWRADGSFLSVQRSRAKPALSKANSSLRRSDETGQPGYCRHRRVDRGGGWRIHRGSQSTSASRRGRPGGSGTRSGANE